MKKILLLFLFLAFKTYGASPAFENAASGSTSTGNNISGSLTINSNSNKILLCHTHNAGTLTVSNIVFAGQSMTKLSSVQFGTLNVYDSETWYLISPPVGTNQVWTVTLSGTLVSAAGTAVMSYYSGVDPFSPFDTTVTRTATGTTAQISLISTFSNDELVGFYSDDLQASTITDDGNWNQHSSVTQGTGIAGSRSRELGRQATTAQLYGLTETANSSTNWCIIETSLKAVQPTATPTFTASITPTFTTTATKTQTQTASPTSSTTPTLTWTQTITPTWTPTSTTTPTASPTSTATPTYTLTPGIFAHWPLWSDGAEIVSGYNAVNSNGVPQGPGPGGQPASGPFTTPVFPATTPPPNFFVVAPAFAGQMNILTQQYQTEFYAYINMIDIANGQIFFLNGGNALGFSIVNSGKVQWNANGLLKTTALTPGIWHRIDASYDGTTKRIYVDGAINVSSVDSNTFSAVTGENSYFGLQVVPGFPTTGPFYDGYIHDISFANYAVCTGTVCGPMVMVPTLTSTPSISPTFTFTQTVTPSFTQTPNFTSTPSQTPYPTASPSPTPGNGVVSQYFNGSNFNTFVGSAVVSGVNFYFSPPYNQPGFPVGINPNAWSAYFAGYLAPTTTENYTFQVTTSDGVIVSLDGAQIITTWIVQPPTVYTSSAIPLIAGSHHYLFIQYFKGNTDASQLNLKWSAPTFTGGIFKIIGKQYLSH